MWTTKVVGKLDDCSLATQGKAEKSFTLHWSKDAELASYADCLTPVPEKKKQEKSTKLRDDRERKAREKL